MGLIASVVVAYAAWLGSKIQHGDAANPTSSASAAQVAPTGSGGADPLSPAEEDDVTDVAHLPYKVVRADMGEQAAFLVHGRKFLPQELSAMVLAEAKKPTTISIRPTIVIGML